MKDLHNNITVRRAISPVDMVDDTAQVSEIIDLQGFESCEFLIATGSLADAGATFAALLEEGDTANLADAAAVADKELLGTEALASFTQADDNSAFKLGYRGTKRYVRLTVTPTGNAAAALISAVAVLGHPHVI